jgi:predicted N-formylglutamate amidohydrolase
MRADSAITEPGPFAAVVENEGGQSPILLLCEHASNALPAPWHNLGLSADQTRAHIAWDPGALGLARGLSQRLDATLIHAPVSRLIYDCNRAPDMAGAMPARSEVHDIPGNAAITPEDRLARTRAVYLPWVAAVHEAVAARIAKGPRPVIVTIHSFTPVFHGQPRAVEFGVIHDADPRLALAICAAAQAKTPLNTQVNQPYSAADDVTHTLRLQATPYGLANAMLEIRNDLIATAQDQMTMAATLAPVLTQALAQLRNAA